MLSALRAEFQKVKAYPLRGSAYLDIAGCTLYGMAGLVGGGTMMAPAIFNDPSRINWPMVFVGVYTTATGSILLATGKDVQNLESKIVRITSALLTENEKQSIRQSTLDFQDQEQQALRKKLEKPGLTGQFARATRPMLESWLDFRCSCYEAAQEVSIVSKRDLSQGGKLATLRFVHTIAQKPIETQAFLNIPLFAAFGLAPLFGGGTAWSYAKAVASLSSTSLRLLVPEPRERAAFRDFVADEKARPFNPLRTIRRYARHYPLSADGLLQLTMQAFNMAGAASGAPGLLGVSAGIIMGSKIWRMTGSKNQNIAPVDDNRPSLTAKL